MTTNKDNDTSERSGCQSKSGRALTLAQDGEWAAAANCRGQADVVCTIHSVLSVAHKALLALRRDFAAYCLPLCVWSARLRCALLACVRHVWPSVQRAALCVVQNYSLLRYFNVSQNHTLRQILCLVACTKSLWCA
jgi:hypothetical protein